MLQETVSVDAVAKAWSELRGHPALVWIPPVWRSGEEAHFPDAVVRRHSISAVDRNLMIDICTTPGGLEVRLAIGPLTDRPLSNGAVDQTAPAAAADARLMSVAPTFEQALLKLRDAVVRSYGQGT